MKEISRVIIPVKQGNPWIPAPGALHWDGDTLVDWLAGGNRYGLNGEFKTSRIAWGNKFDAAAVSNCGAYVALYERLGTKALVLKNGAPLRELKRSFTFASQYEYPLTFLILPGGRTGIAHCPDSNGTLEIEDAETGERLTARSSKGEKHFFHSRLSATSDGSYLASSGWVWGPWDQVYIYDVNKVLGDPELLDNGQYLGELTDEPINFAVLNARDSLVFTVLQEGADESPASEADQGMLPPNTIAVYDVHTKALRSHALLSEQAGLIFPVDDRYVLGLFQHPKLIDLTTGQIIARWEEFATGTQMSSILLKGDFVPTVAVDSSKKRFAIAGDDSITVIQLG